MLVSLHIWRVRKDGLSGADAQRRPVEENGGASSRHPRRRTGLMALTRRPRASVEARDPDDEVFAWPHLLYRELLVALGVVVALHVVSLLFMAPLEEMADPTRTPNPAKAPWYFLGLQELVHYSAFIGGVLVPDADRAWRSWRCRTSIATRAAAGAGSRRSGAWPTRSSPRRGRSSPS